MPIAAFEVDCNFEYEIWWPTYGGWCWKDWSQWNATAFPSGGNLSAKLGGMPMTYYVSPFCNDTVHRKDHAFIDAPVGGKMMAIAAPNVRTVRAIRPTPYGTALFSFPLLFVFQT